MKLVILISLFTVLYTTAYSQSKAKFVKMFERQIAEIRDDNNGEPIFSFFQYTDSIPEKVLEVVQKYENDSLPRVREFIYSLMFYVGTGTDEISLRQRSTEGLIKGCFYKENLTKNSARLEKFKKEDFSDKSKEKLSEFLQLEFPFHRKIVKIIGYLEMREQIPALETLLTDTTHNDRETFWNIHCSLARMGQEEHIDYCIDFIKSMQISDAVVYNLLPDIVYIRQKQSSDYLVELLNSNKLDCSSANPNNPQKITCAYRIMEMLAKVVKDYPYELGIGDELEVDNYEDALEAIRIWFDENPDYEIIKNRY